MTRQLFAAAFALMLLGSVPVNAAPPATRKSATSRQAIFDQVWRTVRDAHYDPKMNGVDWNAVRTKYAPQATKAKDETQFYSVLNTMLGELKQSHLGAIAPSVVSGTKTVSPNATVPGATGDSGITAQWVDNEPVVVRVAENSAGAAAGVKPGFVVVAVNGKAVAPVLQKLIAANPHPRPGEERVAVWAALSTILSGVVGSPYTLAIKDASDIEQVLTVTPRKSSAKLIAFGALPPIPADFETRTLADGIGYIRFSIFLLPLSEPVKDTIRGFAAAKASGVIIDLRGNRGGIGVMASGIAGTFTATETNLGTMRTRMSPAPLLFKTNPQEPVYTGRIVILTDEGSISTSEIMAAGLQEAKRATIIGRQTAGMVLPSQIITLPDGGRLQYVFADFRTPSGTVLEGRGVLPDVPVTLSRATLAASPGGDPILDAALLFLQTKEPVKP